MSADTYPRTWSSPSGLTCYRIVDPGDPDRRRMEWCPGKDGTPLEDAEWRKLDDNTAGCYEILRLDAEVERLKGIIGDMETADETLALPPKAMEPHEMEEAAEEAEVARIAAIYRSGVAAERARIKERLDRAISGMRKDPAVSEWHAQEFAAIARNACLRED